MQQRAHHNTEDVRKGRPGSWIFAVALALFLSPRLSGTENKSGSRHLARLPAPATDLSTAYAFPVPFKPTPANNRITFTNLSFEATIRVYTLAGELVRTLQESDGDGILKWDVTSDQGVPLASEVYVYVIENKEQTKVGKLLVVR